MTSEKTVKPKSVTDRRTLRFGRLRDALEDVEALARQGEVRSTANWTPAQIVEHVTRVVDWSIDGFPAGKAPWPLRVIGRVLKDRALNRPMSAGFKVPGVLGDAVPDASFEFETALGHLRRTVERLDGGARMEQPSPLFGPLEHEQWEQLHCRHAELHFGFLKES